MKIKPIIKQREKPLKTAKYLSFDVGIINLAYCILDTDGNIMDWNIINLAAGNTKLKCSASVKSGTRMGTKCTKKAFYVHKDSPRKGLCIRHNPRDTDSQLYERNITVENSTEYELKAKLFQILDQNKLMMTVDTVLIEYQCNKAREKIKSISHAIFDYFVLRSLDTGHQFNTIRFIDAKNKLTVYDGPPLSCHLKTQYARNKWYGQRYCEYLLEHKQHDKLKFFRSHRKKDDLADCYLQAIWYIKFGQHGVRAPITSSHQKLVYRENNILTYKKVRAYAPSSKAKARRRYTVSNIKYLIQRHVDIEKDVALKNSIEFYFGSVDEFKKAIRSSST